MKTPTPDDVRFRITHLKGALCILTLLAATLLSSSATAQVPVDPKTLVVVEPKAPRTRTPTKAIEKLLRVELSILKAAEELDFNIARRTDELERLRAQLVVLEADLAKTTKRFKAETQRLNNQRRLVRRRIRAMVQFRRVEPYQFLFGAKAYATFFPRQRTIKRLLQEDKRRIARYRKELDRWRKERADLQRRRRNVTFTQKQIRYLLQELQWDREEKSALMQAVRKRSSFHGEVAKEMQGVDRALIAELRKLRGNYPRLWFEERRGKHVRPIRRGVVIAKFGRRVHKKFGTTTIHRGIAMVPDNWDGQREVPVRAMYYGYVAFAGWKRGLGNVIVVDHTRGFMTLYGHLERIDIKKGQMVRPGQHIALMGDSGSLWGKRLHFEIRKNGKAMDPLRKTRWFQ